MIFDQWGDQYHCDSPARLLRQAAAGAIILAFVPIEDDQIIRAILFQRGEQLVKEFSQPDIRLIPSAVVPVVADIWSMIVI